MKAKIVTIEGNIAKDVTLPMQFNTPYRPDVIKRAVLASISSRIQPKGNFKRAGRQNTAEYIGRRHAYRSLINIGHARLPRMKNLRFGFLGKVARVPQAVGGPRAHPPKVEKILAENINVKERRLAIRSAIAATANKDLVIKRGHKIPKNIQLPLIIENKFEKLKATKDVLKVLDALGLTADIERAKKGKNIRAGVGKRRGRKYKRRKSLLIVTGDNAEIYRAARNLEGVDIVAVRNLNAELLAPGTHPGRLTIWTESAVEKLDKERLFN